MPFKIYFLRDYYLVLLVDALRATEKKKLRDEKGRNEKGFI